MLNNIQLKHKYTINSFKHTKQNTETSYVKIMSFNCFEKVFLYHGGNAIILFSDK